MNAVPLSFDSVGDAGTKNDVVILHGLFGMGRNWAGIARALADSRRVLTVDLRNHGDSPWADDMTYEAMAADVARLIETECTPPSTVIGHSMGGKAAMTLALSHPEVIARLVVVDIAPVPYNHDFESHLRAMANLDVTAYTRRAEAEAALLDALGDPFLAKFLIRNLKTDPDHHGFTWGVNLDALARHMDDILDFPVFEADAAFEAPALFIAGARSEYIQPHHQGEIERLFPNAEMQVVDGAGHWAHADKPGEVTALLANFIGA